LDCKCPQGLGIHVKKNPKIANFANLILSNGNIQRHLFKKLAFYLRG